MHKQYKQPSLAKAVFFCDFVSDRISKAFWRVVEGMSGLKILANPDIIAVNKGVRSWAGHDWVCNTVICVLKIVGILNVTVGVANPDRLCWVLAVTQQNNRCRFCSLLLMICTLLCSANVSVGVVSLYRLSVLFNNIYLIVTTLFVQVLLCKWQSPLSSHSFDISPLSRSGGSLK